LLQRIAKSELASFNDTSKGWNTPSTTNYKGGLPNKYLDRMNDEQRFVFCSIYYSKKTTAQLAAEINKPEEQIKQSLKEAFAIIRKANEN
jgi:uncharacterized protein YktB (UPF0637 family)